MIKHSNPRSNITKKIYMCRIRKNNIKIEVRECTKSDMKAFPIRLTQRVFHRIFDFRIRKNNNSSQTISQKVYSIFQC
jgi:hypothetical protein